MAPLASLPNRFLVTFDFLMRHIYQLVLILVLFVSCTNSKKQEQESPVKLPPLTAAAFKKLFTYTLSWIAIEKKAPDEIKLKWFKDHAPWAIAGGVNEGTLSSLHAINFDGDTTSDFIYTGSGPVTYYTTITLNDKVYFQNSALITGFDFTNGRVTRIYFSEILGSGGPSVEGYIIVDVVYNGAQPKFMQRIECEQIYEGHPPRDFTCFSIESIADTIIARYDPIELDTPYNFVLELPGNQFGKILKGTQAIVAGTKRDSLNSLWYFAFVKPEFKIHNYPLRMEPKDSLHRIVWVKADGWKKLEP